MKVPFAVFSAGLVVVSACASDPKPEPTAATATASAEPPPPAPATASATAAPSASAAPDGKSDKQTECDSLVEDANTSLDAKRIEFAEKACKKDADCVAIKGHACSFNCSNGAVPKSEEKAWNDSVTKVKDGACKKWTDNECSKLRTKPPPTCQDKKPACDKGRCILK